MNAATARTAAGEGVPDSFMRFLDLESEIDEAVGMFVLLDTQVRHLWDGDLKKRTPGNMALYEFDPEEVEGVQFGMSDLGTRIRGLRDRFYQMSEARRAEVRHG